MVRLSLLLVLLAACGTSTSHAPGAAVAAPVTTAPLCERDPQLAKIDKSGEARVPATDGTVHLLYWVRLSAKTQPAKGTLFYLAGGPLSHMGYTKLAALFQSLAFPGLDVILY